MKEKKITRADVRAAYARYMALRSAVEKAQKQEPFPNFPTGGDPRLELFNTMSRILEERTTMIAEAERVGERRAGLGAGSGNGRLGRG